MRKNNDKGYLLTKNMDKRKETVLVVVHMAFLKIKKIKQIKLGGFIHITNPLL